MHIARVSHDPLDRCDRLQRLHELMGDDLYRLGVDGVPDECPSVFWGGF